MRIVAATNRDLEKEVAEGRFREDLFYRLKVFPIQCAAAARAPRGRAPCSLAIFFLERYAKEFGRSVQGFSQEAMELLMVEYKWPGNVRELENEVQRVGDPGGRGRAHRPRAPLRAHPPGREPARYKVHPTKGTLKQMMSQVEKWILREALKDHDNNKSQTAKTLGITREGLHKKLKGYGMT